MSDGAGILHLDIDAFFAAVEQVLFPQLRGRPVIVGNGVIASVSYEGRKFGLHAGMPLWEARRLCPQVVILDGSYPIYNAYAARVFELCATRTPVMETFLDEAYLDMNGAERLFGSFPGVASALRREISADTGLTVTCGVAPNRMLAKMISKLGKPDGLTVLEANEVEDFLPPRAIAELPGVGPKIARDMHDYGVHTVGEFRDFSRDVLKARYGKNGFALYERARGRDTIAVTPREVPRTISRETSFHIPTSDPDEIAGMLSYLSGRAMRTARGLGLRVGRIDVSASYEDGRGNGRGGERFRPPTSDDCRAFTVAREVLERIHTRRVNLRRIGVVLSSFSFQEPIAQQVLFDPEGEKQSQRLADAVDRIRDRFGHSAIVAGPAIDLIGNLEQNREGFILRTPSLTK